MFCLKSFQVFEITFLLLCFGHAIPRIPSADIVNFLVAKRIPPGFTKRQRYKARLVAKGYTQVQGEDFTEVFEGILGIAWPKHSSGSVISKTLKDYKQTFMPCISVQTMNLN